LEIIRKYVWLQLVAFLFMNLFLCLEAYSDTHIIYKNRKNSAEKLEIFSKNGLLKVFTSDGSVKIVNLLDGEIILFKSDDKKYLKIKLPQDEKKNNKRKKEDLFSPTIEILKDKKVVSGVEVSLMKYRSKIDAPATIYVSKIVPGDEITMMRICLSHLSSRGMEFLKQPAYFYALNSGFMPLRIRGKKTDWIATSISSDELKDETFKAPKGMALWKTKDYYRFVVEKTAQGMDSKVNP